MKKKIVLVVVTMFVATSCKKEDKGAASNSDKKQTPAAKATPAKAGAIAKTKAVDKKIPVPTDKTANPPKTGSPTDVATPADAPFAFKIPAVATKYDRNEFVWAMYPANNTGTWVYNRVRYKGAKGEWAEVGAMRKATTHSAFIHKAVAPDKKLLKKGTPVKCHVGIGVKYGRVVSLAGDKVKVAFYVSGPKSGERELPLESVELWTKAALEPGTTVTYKDGDLTKLATLGLVAGGKAYIASPKGLAELDVSDVKPIDPKPVFKVGTAVWGYSREGLGSYKMMKGKITKVHDKGVWYEWKSDNGKRKAKLSYAKVAKL